MLDLPDVEELEILAYPDVRLETACIPVSEFNEDLNKYSERMIEIMRSANGMGLSANQVGIMQRFFVMVPKLEDKMFGPPIVLINPRIIERSDDFANLSEGCLSAPNLYYVAKDRLKSVTVEFQDLNGVVNIQTFTGINSVCVQHEIDHLDGVFFFDRLNRQNKREAEKKLKKQRQL